MADVTGQIGNEEVVLNNAATEATLKQLLAAMTALAKAQGVEIKNAAGLDKDLGKLGKQTENAVRSGRKFQRTQDGTTKSSEKLGDALDETAESTDSWGQGLKDSLTLVGKMGQQVQKAIDFIGGSLSSISNMGDSITSATDTLGNIPLVGDAIKGVYGPVAGAVETLQTQFQAAASVGANFGGNIAEFSKAAGGAGMTMEQFAGVVQKNSANLIFLAGGTAEGAKRLADMGKSIRKSRVGDELARLGFSTVDINDGLAQYGARLQRLGRNEQLTNKQLIAGTTAYMKNLDAVSKLTGKSKEALQSEQDARNADAQFRIMMSKLSKEERIEMDMLMDAIPAAHQTGIKEILATGTATSEEGVKAMAFLRESSGEAQALFKKIESGEQLEAGFASDFYDTYAAEAKKFAESPIGETLGKFDDSMNDFYTAADDVGKRATDLATVIDDQKKEQEKLKEDLKKGVEGVIDPASIKTFKENIAEASTAFTTMLGSIDLAPLEKVFNKALKAAEDYLVPALNMAANNFDKFVIAAGLANGALKALELAAGAAAAAQLLGVGARGLKPGPGGGAPLKPGTPGAAGPGGAVKGAAKNMMKRAGPLGLLYGLYEGYSDYSQVEADLDAGNITSGEATVEKSGVVGSVTGGTGGAMAGAAAGAAIGSVVPVVGTLIGGVIGGAFGYWAGSSAGEAIGETIGEALVGPETVSDIQAKIAAEEERIKRSEEGVNEYWGRESKGREESLAQIEQYKKDLALIDENNRIVEEKKRKEAEANGEVVVSPENPTTTTAEEQKALELKAEEERKAKEAELKKKQIEQEKKKLEEEKKLNPDGTPMSSNTVHKTPDQLLADLNTSMNQLVQIATTQTMIAKKQLGVSGEQIGDLYASV
jgi:hypothetical protein